MTVPADHPRPSTPTPARSTAPQAQRPSTRRPTPERASAALVRYRVMAWITGTMLLVLTLELVLKYVLQVNGVDADGHAEPVLGTWVAFAHGWIYVVYLLSVASLWGVMRWPLTRLATMALAGVVPGMSFVLERRIHADALVRIERLRAASVPPSTGDAVTGPGPAGTSSRGAGADRPEG